MARVGGGGCIFVAFRGSELFSYFGLREEGAGEKALGGWNPFERMGVVRGNVEKQEVLPRGTVSKSQGLCDSTQEEQQSHGSKTRKRLKIVRINKLNESARCSRALIFSIIYLASLERCATCSAMVIACECSSYNPLNDFTFTGDYPPSSCLDVSQPIHDLLPNAILLKHHFNYLGHHASPRSTSGRPPNRLPLILPPQR